MNTHDAGADTPASARPSSSPPGAPAPATPVPSVPVQSPAPAPAEEKPAPVEHIRGPGPTRTGAAPASPERTPAPPPGKTREAAAETTAGVTADAVSAGFTADARVSPSAEAVAAAPADAHTHADAHALADTHAHADTHAGDDAGAAAGPVVGPVGLGAGGRQAVPGTGPSVDGPRTGVAALSPRYQFCAAVAVAVVAVAVCVHLGMVFLHVAPSNTMTKTHGEAVDDWVYPEFEQNWKLFAPNPLQQNIAVQVRAQTRTPDGSSHTTGWYDLSAQDGRAIDGNPLPSHTQQNELRRAWDFFSSTHGGDNRPVGERGALSEAYLRRIVVLRLQRSGVAGADGVVERVQVRSRTVNVPPPDWSEETISLEPVFRVLPWWTVSAGETDGGAR